MISQFEKTEEYQALKKTILLRNKEEEGVAKVIIRDASESPETLMRNEMHAYKGVIYFHKSILSKEYRTKLTKSRPELFRVLKGNIKAIQRMEYAYPLYQQFSLQRALMHEFQHAANSWNLFSDEMKHAINPTNHFMQKYYGEQMRLDHTSVRNTKNSPLIHNGFKPQELW